MRPRALVIVGFHAVVALLFVGAAAVSAYHGQIPGAIVEAVVGVLVLTLGVGLARAA